MDAGNMLKPALARGELRCIGATTLDEYRKHVEKDKALERRFQPVYTLKNQPSNKQSVSYVVLKKNMKSTTIFTSQTLRLLLLLPYQIAIFQTDKCRIKRLT